MDETPQFMNYNKIKMISFERRELPEYVRGGPSISKTVINDYVICGKCLAYIPTELREEIRNSPDQNRIWEINRVISGKEEKIIVQKSDVLGIKDQRMGCGKCELVPDEVKQKLNRGEEAVVLNGQVYSVGRMKEGVAIYDVNVDLKGEMAELLEESSVVQQLDDLEHLLGKDISPEELMPRESMWGDACWKIPESADYGLGFCEPYCSKKHKNLLLKIGEYFNHEFTPRVSIAKIKYLPLK